MWLLLAAALLCTGTLLHARYGTYHLFAPSGHARGLDDAYITFRYAQHLAEGYGLVFNIGERVEGFSNPLYTVLLAGVIRVLAVEDLYRVALVLNIGFMLAALVVLHRAAERRYGARAASLAAFLFALTPSVWLWAGAGLETPLVVLSVLGAWSAFPGAERRGSLPWLMFWIMVLIATRVDGFLLAGTFVVALAATGRHRMALKLFAGGALMFCALLMWRELYFGAPWPNTFYAKICGPVVERVATGGRFFRLALSRMNLWPYVVAITVTGILALRRRGGDSSPRADLIDILVPSVAIAHFVQAGGDDLGERFLMPVVVLGVVLGSAAIVRLRRGWVVPAGVLAVLLTMSPLVRDPRFKVRQDKYDFLVELGVFLRTEGSRSVAVEAAGKPAFFGQLETIDMLGLTDWHIARTPARSSRPGHCRFDPEYVLARRPDLIATGVDPALNGRWGMDRERYEAAGYRLKYLLNITEYRFPRNILPVEGLSSGETTRLIEAGYAYGILGRYR